MEIRTVRSMAAYRSHCTGHIGYRQDMLGRSVLLDMNMFGSYTSPAYRLYTYEYRSTQWLVRWYLNTPLRCHKYELVSYCYLSRTVNIPTQSGNSTDLSVLYSVLVKTG